METLAELIARVALDDEAAFAAAHPHPFLLFHFAQTDDTARSFKTTTSIGPEARETDVPITKDTLVAAVRPKEAGATKVTLGRAPNTDLCLPYPKISKLHAMFTHTADEWKLLDVGSTNGTYINGRQLQPKVAEPIPDGALLNFWHIAARYCLAPRLFRYLRALG